MRLSGKEIQRFQEKMLSWYQSNGRDFPWRRTDDPYKILVSEILLQKTHVRNVEKVYWQIVKAYPNIYALKDAQPEELVELIRPLGFLNRAERLLSLSKTIVDSYNGKIPAEYKTLLSFKGIGEYIATAIMVFAFNEKRVVVDTNVIKILEHEFGYHSDKSRPRTDKNLWDFAQTLAPDFNIKEFNWALLDYAVIL
jgi:A/G-specific adenine glycosylase